jgi:hypothetical protein
MSDATREEPPVSEQQAQYVKAEAFTMTFCGQEQAIGIAGRDNSKGDAKNGIEPHDLQAWEKFFGERGCLTRMIDLKKLCLNRQIDDNLKNDKEFMNKVNHLPPSQVLIVTGALVPEISGHPGLDYMEAHNDIVKELYAMPWQVRTAPFRAKKDAPFRTNNKQARYNNVIADYTQAADIEHDKGTVNDSKDYPAIHALREAMSNFIDKEGPLLPIGCNAYPAGGGISLHGDGERPLMASLRLGPKTHEHVLKFQFQYKDVPVGREVEIDMTQGDLSFFTQHATGWNHENKKELTVRHAAYGFKPKHVDKYSISGQVKPTKTAQKSGRPLELPAAKRVKRRDCVVSPHDDA